VDLSSTTMYIGTGQQWSIFFITLWALPSTMTTTDKTAGRVLLPSTIIPSR
jgi:hypothetical protein